MIDDKSNEIIKIFPDLLLAAIGKNLGGSYRLWFLGKHFNSTGSGVIISDAFRSYSIEKVGISRSSFYGWLRKSASLNLIENDGKNLKLLGYRDAAIMVGCLNLHRPIYLEIEKLFLKGWQSWLWAGYLKSCGLENKIISRKSLRLISGIPERTQREYNKNIGIKSEANYAMIECVKGTQEIVNGLNEFERSRIKSKVFLRNGGVLWRRPNKYLVHGLSIGSKYSARRINQRLQNLFLIGGRDSDSLPIIRLNCTSERQIEKTLRRIHDLSDQGVKDLPKIIYKKSWKDGLYNAVDVF